MTIECTIPYHHMLTCSVPLHSFKFVAALQHAAGATNKKPFLLRHHLKAGHGAGKPTQKVIDEATERFAFMMLATESKYCN
jgi:prolyl oligopeptidase